jgi:hypothetical protein
MGPTTVGWIFGSVRAGGGAGLASAVADPDSSVSRTMSRAEAHGMLRMILS